MSNATLSPPHTSCAKHVVTKTFVETELKRRSGSNGAVRFILPTLTLSPNLPPLTKTRLPLAKPRPAALPEPPHTRAGRAVGPAATRRMMAVAAKNYGVGEGPSAAKSHVAFVPRPRRTGRPFASRLRYEWPRVRRGKDILGCPASLILPSIYRVDGSPKRDSLAA